jgi:hypothetical protein
MSEMNELQINTRVRANILGRGIADCTSTEPNFVRTISQLETGEYEGQDIISVYTDSLGAPLAVRKYSDNDSAIILKNMRLVEGQVGILRAGMIVEIDDTTAAKAYKTSYYDQWQLTAYNGFDTLCVIAGRMCLWEDPNVRILGDPLDEDAQSYANQYRLYDMIKAATKALRSPARSDASEPSI